MHEIMYQQLNICARLIVRVYYEIDMRGVLIDVSLLHPGSTRVVLGYHSYVHNHFPFLKRVRVKLEA